MGLFGLRFFFLLFFLRFLVDSSAITAHIDLKELLQGQLMEL